MFWRKKHKKTFIEPLRCTKPDCDMFGRKRLVFFEEICYLDQACLHCIYFIRDVDNYQPIEEEEDAK